jgi:hypothetical protein
VRGGLYEDSLLLAMLGTSIHARGISNVTIGQRRNVLLPAIAGGGGGME